MRKATCRTFLQVSPLTSAIILATIINRAGVDCFIPQVWKYGESVSKQTVFWDPPKCLPSRGVEAAYTTGKPKIGVWELLGPSLHHLCVSFKAVKVNPLLQWNCTSAETVAVFTPLLAGLLLLCHGEPAREICGGGAKWWC